MQGRFGRSEKKFRQLRGKLRLCALWRDRNPHCLSEGLAPKKHGVKIASAYGDAASIILPDIWFETLRCDEGTLFYALCLVTIKLRLLPVWGSLRKWKAFSRWGFAS